MIELPSLRRLLGCIIVGLSVVSSTACSGSGPKAKRVLVVTIDTLRWDRLGYTGYDVETPNLDALAATGTTFTRAVTVAPLTLPAHSSLFTGLYPPRHGVRANGIFRLEDDVETAAEIFGKAGYATAAFVGAFVLDRRFGLAQGFDVYDDELPEENAIDHAYFAERPASEVVARATAWIRARGDEPFFVWVHVFDPHAPYAPPAPYDKRYASRPYDGEIAATDRALGPLFDLVSEMDDSVVVVTSDHGESLGEHGESTHGLFIYESTTRVPLVMNGAGISAGKTIDSRVRIVDIAPTILELAGLELANAIDGESLLSLSTTENAPSRDAYSESLLPRYSFNWSELRSFRRGPLKYVQAPQPELYDLDADPGEATNLWDGPRAQAATTLVSELSRMAAAERHVPKPLELDDDTARRLESLGYVASTASRAGEETDDRVDPKDRIEVYEHMQELLSPDLTPEEALAGHRAILELEPANALARNRLANTLSELGRLDEATVEYRRLVQDSEIDFRGLENLSAVLLLNRETDEALATTAMAVAAAPWNPDFLVLRGEALEQADRVEEARDAYARAVALAPLAENFWRLGAVHEKLGAPDEAETRYRRALENDDAFEPALAALARLYVRTGRTAEAYALLETAPSGIDESSAAIATATAEAHLAAGRTEEAKAILEKARRDFPENTRVLALLGPLYVQMGQPEPAMEALQAALDLGETSPDVRRNLAVLLLREGSPQKAVALLEQARETAPDSAPVWYSLGNAYYRAGATAKAVSAFERALELRSPWPEAAFNLGVAAQQIGQNDKAVDAYRDFLDSASASDTRRRDEAERQLRRLSQGS